jgi:steroid 5-alpha reductase family enzyme
MEGLADLIKNNLNMSLSDSELLPLTISLYICIGASLFCWIASLITGNFSFVDRLWSILPMTYAWVFTLFPVLKGDGINLRMLISTILVTMWGSRLTYNFYRKGGYSLSS